MRSRNGGLTLWERFPILEAFAAGAQAGIFGAIGGAFAGGLVGVLASGIPVALTAAACGVAVVGTVATAVTSLARTMPIYRPSHTFAELGAGFAVTAALAFGINCFQPHEAPPKKLAAATDVTAVFAQSAAPKNSPALPNAERGQNPEVMDMAIGACLVKAAAPSLT